ncbi:MAG TPA: hypothetical protein VFG21_08015 [Xanthomonadaceae bacterium]|nr:hypothetical protein [Xanthomonadaceae bacterium]
MNQAYSRLRDALPKPGKHGGQAFPTDVRRVRNWVEHLPRANLQATLRQVSEALEALLQEPLRGNRRAELLEELRPPALECIVALQRQFASASLPLGGRQAEQAASALHLHELLSRGYALACVEITAPEGRVPMMGARAVTTAIERGMHHALQRLALAYEIYSTPPAGAWSDLHRLHAVADATAVADRAVADPARGADTSAAMVYAQAALLAISNPYRFTQRDQAALWTLTRDLAPNCRVDRERPAAGGFAVPTGGDEGPGYIPEERVEVAEDAMWLDLGLLPAALDAALPGGSGGEVLLRVGRGRGIVAPTDLLRMVRASWEQSAARGHQRMEAGHVLDTVVGLSSLHFHLAGRQDFDTFMQFVRGNVVRVESATAAWTHASVSMGEVPIARARVLDQSLGGYRLRWDSDQQIRARVGELIGMAVAAEDDLRDWMVGRVRWLRYEPDGAVHAGIELMARRAVAVAVRGLDGRGAAMPAVRALQLDAIANPGHEAVRLLVPTVLDVQASRIEIGRVGETVEAFETPMPAQSVFERMQVLEHAGDYYVLAAHSAVSRVA